MADIEFRQIETDVEAEHAKLLVREYLGWLNDRLKRQYDMQFDADAMVVSDITDRDKFFPPNGRFYLILCGGEAAGIGCLKKLAEGVGEIQRMYVSAEFRGRGIGRAIAERLVADAKQIGYKTLRLESLKFLDSAHALYRSLGFRTINPYAGNSMESYQEPGQLANYYSITVFMELQIEHQHE